MLRSYHSGVWFVTPGRALFVALLLSIWILRRQLPQYEPLIKANIQGAGRIVPEIILDWPVAERPQSSFNSSKVAVLIESRPIHHLPPLVLHMIAVAPPDWRFLFIGSRESLHLMTQSRAIKHQQTIGKLDLIGLPAPWSIASSEDVFRLWTDVRFYNEFLPRVEWILKYEHDSILCANAETSLNDWLHWSWAGAPRTENDRFSGNGGLSLRRVSVIKRILRFQSRFNDSEPEDEWFGKRLWVLPGAKVASKLEGAITVEDVYMEKPLGYHLREGGASLNDQVWGDAVRRKEIFEYCPEVSMIMDMKLERERCPDDDGNGDRGPIDVDVTVSVLGEDGDSKDVIDGGDTTIGPPQPPPLPRPWVAIVSSAGNGAAVHLA